MEDLYEILHVSEDATEDELKKAYRDLAKKYHPDSNPDNEEVSVKFQEINKAYSTLGDPQKRKQYDMKRSKTVIHSSKSSNDFDSSVKSFSDADITNIIFKDEIEKFIKDRADYLAFLDNMEIEYNKYGLSLVQERKAVLNSTWSLASLFQNFDDKKAEIKRKFFDLKRNTQAFDEFSSYYQQISQTIQNLYGKKLVHFDEYLDPQNRTAFSPEVFLKQRQLIGNVISSLQQKREEKIERLRKRFMKRDSNFDLYLGKKGTNASTISAFDIQTMLDSMTLLDTIDMNLVPFGLNTEALLQMKGKSLSNVKYEELLSINEVVNNYISEVKNNEEVSSFNDSEKNSKPIFHAVSKK